jgi:hypothetical protein
MCRDPACVVGGDDGFICTLKLLGGDGLISPVREDCDAGSQELRAYQARSSDLASDSRLQTQVRRTGVTRNSWEVATPLRRDDAKRNSPLT